MTATTTNRKIYLIYPKEIVDYGSDCYLAYAMDEQEVIEMMTSDEDFCEYYTVDNVKIDCISPISVATESSFTWVDGYRE